MNPNMELEYDARAGRWSAVFPALPGCASAGDTEEEASRNAKEALALWMELPPLGLANALTEG